MDKNSLFGLPTHYQWQRRRWYRWMWHQLRTETGVDYKKYVKHTYRIPPPVSLWWWKRYVPHNTRR